MYACKICCALVVEWSSQCMKCGAAGAIERPSPAELARIRKANARIRNAAEEEHFRVDERADEGGGATRLQVDRVDDIETEQIHRLETGEPNADRVLGGGWAGSKLYGLYAPAGSGKSRWCRSVISRLARHGRVAFFSASNEEHKADIKRHLINSGDYDLPYVRKNLLIIDHADDADAICEVLEDEQPIFTVYDAISATETEGFGLKGSKEQIRYAMGRFRAIIEKRPEASMVCLMHDNKRGQVAGPNEVAFLFDTMLRIQKVRWTVGGTGVSFWDPIPGDEPSRFVKLGSTGKTRYAPPEEFQIYELTTHTIVPLLEDPTHAGTPKTEPVDRAPTASYAPVRYAYPPR